MKKAVFCLVLLCACFSINSEAQQILNKQSLQPVARGIVNVKQMAERDALLPRPSVITTARVPNEEEEEYDEAYSPFSPVPARGNAPNGIAVVSPSPILTYEGAPDEAQGGGASGTWNIPPDTYGAVGLDKVFVTLNNNYRILDKATGAQLSLISAETYWSSLGSSATGVFDPRIVYDSYNNRWIICAVSNGSSGSSRILLGISQTHDPQGNFNLYAFDPDAGATLWMDFPMLGYNKNWIAISGNMFTLPGAFSEGRVLILDYPALRSGIITSTLVTGISGANGGFCMHPATTYSSSEATLYLTSHLSSGGATYKLSTITGTPAAPVLTIGATKVRPGGGWAAIAGNIFPQQCLSSCPGTLMFADPGDQYNRSNVAFRNGFVWHVQTIQTTAAPVHTMVQWTKLDAVTGDVSDGGRIEDVTATNANGGRWYGHPSIAVNSSNDMVMGFSKGESDGYLGAAYSMRLSTDAAGTMQDPVIYKDGLDYYEKDFGTGRNRWGDYSHTMVDPIDDYSFWTLQEYAKLRAAPSVGGSTSKWGTWWAKVAPNACLSNVASGNWNTAATWGCASVPDATRHVYIISGQDVTLDIDPLAASITVNSGGTLTVNATRTLSCKLIVYGTLNITGGKLNLGSNDVFLSENAILSGASSNSYFVTNGTGVVSKIIGSGASFEFPVAPNTSSYNSLTIANSGGSPDEVFSVRVSAGITPASTNNASCVQRTWNINEMTVGGNSVTLTFKWAAAEHGASFNVGTTPHAYRHNGTIYAMAANMSVPVLASGIYSSSTSGGITNFSPWIVSSAAALPILLEYFTGTRLSNGDHRLEWKANCGGPTANFILQRSNDGTNFYPINTIDGDYMRCQSPFAYSDIQPLPGKNFYRVRMKDEVGKITYSNTVLLLNSKSGFEIVNLQPNPVSSTAALNISVATKEDLSLFITDSKGSRLMQKNFSLNTGMNKVELDLNGIAAGSYLINVVSAKGELRTIRFVKQ